MSSTATFDAASTQRLPGASRRPSGTSFWRKLAAASGPGYLVAVGYMDPGNWATDLAGGSGYGYALLWVVITSSLLAMLLQTLAAKLGVATDLDLASACRLRYPAPVRTALWLLAELAIIACDLAEVIGTALALQLLFSIPMVLGVCLTGLNVFVATLLERRGFRALEAFVAAVMVTVAACLGAELLLAPPDPRALLGGLSPNLQPLSNPDMLFVAAGIVGATIMPHNLYLHSAVVRSPRGQVQPTDKRERLRFAIFDCVLALGLAMLVNAIILIIAASAFHGRGHVVSDIAEAYHLLAPMLGMKAAAVLFAVGLLGSGLISTLTGTLAGQVVMEGFTDLRMPPWARRLLTRALAIVPACAIALVYGDAGTTRLLIASQVVLSLQLPFAIIPLIRVTGDPRWMGSFANGRWLSLAAAGAAALVVLTNVALLVNIGAAALG